VTSSASCRMYLPGMICWLNSAACRAVTGRKPAWPGSDDGACLLLLPGQQDMHLQQLHSHDVSKDYLVSYISVFTWSGCRAVFLQHLSMRPCGGYQSAADVLCYY
jgi:hypothetical protein